MRQSHKTILLWILLILMFVSIYNLFTNPSKSEDKKDFGTFMSQIANQSERDKIKKIVIQPRANNSAKYTVEYKDPQLRKTVTQGEFFGETTTRFHDLGLNYAV